MHGKFVFEYRNISTEYIKKGIFCSDIELSTTTVESIILHFIEYGDKRTIGEFCGEHFFLIMEPFLLSTLKIDFFQIQNKKSNMKQERTLEIFG